MQARRGSQASGDRERRGTQRRRKRRCRRGRAAPATVTAVALPVFGATVLGINLLIKAPIKKEFDRRRVPLPLRLGPGETRSGSFFFPTVSNPQSLTLHWTGGGGDDETTLELNFL